MVRSEEEFLRLIENANWAKENSKLQKTPGTTKWMLDDVRKFCLRQQRKKVN